MLVIENLNRIQVPTEALWAAMCLYTEMHQEVADGRKWLSSLAGILIEQGFESAPELPWAVGVRVEALIRYVSKPDAYSSLTKIAQGTCDDFSDAFVKAAAMASLIETPDGTTMFAHGILEEIALGFLQTRGNA